MTKGKGKPSRKEQGRTPNEKPRYGSRYVTGLAMPSEEITQLKAAAKAANMAVAEWIREVVRVALKAGKK